MHANNPRRNLYSSARAEALKELYKSKDLDKTRPENVEADFEEVAASCGHFSFSLYDFGSEMQNYLSILEELKEQTEKTKKLSWNWLKLWRRLKYFGPASDEEERPLITPVEQSDSPKDVPELIMERRDSKRWTDASQQNDHQGIYRRALRVLRVLERDDG